MQINKKFLALVLAAAGASSAWSQVSVQDPWVRATVPQQTASGAFMRLTATQAARLVEVRSSVAGVVEIHAMDMEGDVMRMRAVTGVELPAGREVALSPGGYHVMLMALKKQLKAGDTVPLTLVVEVADKKRQEIELKVPVRALSTPVVPGHGMGHKY